jgi:serine/threonine-protein kinase
MMADLGFDPEKNKVIPPPVQEDDDKTELLLGNASVPDVQDEDVTLLHLPDDKPKKKSYKKWMIIISLFVFIGICLTLYANRNSLFFNNNADPSMSKVELDYSEHFNLGMEQFSKQNFSRAKEEFNLALSYKETQEARAYLAKIDSLTMLILEPEKVIPEDINPPTEKNTPEIEKTDTSADEYMDLFNQAIHSYQAKNYENAKSILEKLSLTKNTTEVQKYIELTNKELDRIEIEKLKDLYELKMKFGNFVVARKKTTGLYGAIDDNGTEIISCKYRSSEKSGENRSFLRKDDDFYDIYAPNGTLIQERTSTY